MGIDPEGRGAELQLAYRPPFAWEPLLAFFAGRAMPGIEDIRDGVYRRTIEIGDAAGWFSVESAKDTDALALRIEFPEPALWLEIVERVRGIFDLAADPLEITRHLGKDAMLAGLLARHPGVRVPGGWSAFELATRAIVGQQVTVRTATTVAGRLVEGFGRAIPGDGAALTRLFPTPEMLAEADIAPLGMPGRRAEAIRTMARAVAEGEITFDRSMPREEFEEMLIRVPGIGPWTAQYMAMRVLREPDAFPSSDLGLLNAVANGGPRPKPAELARRAEAWRPWRSYAALLLWQSLG
jgi:AraC family transcriptional regulator of adaptative response / DNA-3-methyladenine glycosylase II